LKEKNMAFSVSPAVTVREVDATASIPTVSSTVAAIAGVFHWGPVGERTLVTSETNLVERFGKPSDFNFETFFTAADFLSYSNALYVTRVAEDANTASVSDSTFDALYPGEIGNSLMVSVVTGPTSYRETLATVGNATGSITFGSTSLEFSSDPDFDIVAGDILRIGNNTIGYQDIKVEGISETVVDVNTTTYSVTANNRFSLTADSFADVSIERLWAYNSTVSSAPDTNRFHIAVIDEDGSFSGEAGTVLEVFENVSTSTSVKADDGTSLYYKDVIESRSSFITAGSADVDASGDTVSYQSLTGGLDGKGERTETVVSFGAIAQGYDLYKNADEVDIAFLLQGKALGGANDTGVANYIIDNICETRKDCMVFVSPALTDSVSPSTANDKLSAIKTFAGSINASSYAFIDSGYKYRYDKYNDKYRWVPMNGDIAGTSARIQPWESPAGYKRGVIKNVIKLAYNPPKAHRDELYGLNVNSVITQPGHGTLLFGDKTALGIESSAFSRINVRRLFITVEKAIATTSKYFLFDFNDEFTQSQFKNMVEPYLRDIQGKRGIYDFRVVSDSTVNTPDVVDANTFRANLFIKPARSINYIDLVFVATRTGVQFDEIVGQNL